MTMQDTLADMFIRITNAQSRSKVTVSLPSSKLKLFKLNFFKFFINF